MKDFAIFRETNMLKIRSFAAIVSAAIGFLALANVALADGFGGPSIDPFNAHSLVCKGKACQTCNPPPPDSGRAIPFEEWVMDQVGADGVIELLNPLVDWALTPAQQGVDDMAEEIDELANPLDDMADGLDQAVRRAACRLAKAVEEGSTRPDDSPEGSNEDSSDHGSRTLPTNPGTVQEPFPKTDRQPHADFDVLRRYLRGTAESDEVGTSQPDDGAQHAPTQGAAGQHDTPRAAEPRLGDLHTDQAGDVGEREQLQRQARTQQQLRQIRQSSLPARDTMGHAISEAGANGRNKRIEPRAVLPGARQEPKSLAAGKPQLQTTVQRRASLSTGGRAAPDRQTPMLRSHAPAQARVQGLHSLTLQRKPAAAAMKPLRIGRVVARPTTVQPPRIAAMPRVAMPRLAKPVQNTPRIVRRGGIRLQ